MIDHPRIPIAGVIGSPVAHSKSPRLHSHWLKTYGIRGHYIPMDVAQSDLKQVIAALPKAGFVGVNVTIPHKETVLALADASGPAGQQQMPVLAAGPHEDGNRVGVTFEPQAQDYPLLAQLMLGDMSAARAQRDGRRTYRGILRGTWDLLIWAIRSPFGYLALALTSEPEDADEPQLQPVRQTRPVGRRSKSHVTGADVA